MNSSGTDNSLPENGNSAGTKTEKAKETNSDLNYDEILEHLGQLGKYQLRAYVLLCFPILFPSIVIMSYSFIGGVPNYRCFVEGCDNSNDTDSEFYPNWINNTIPWDELAKRPGFSRCYMYNHTWENVEECNLGDNDMLIENQVKTCDDQWIYDASIFGSTIFTEFELTCENEWMQPIPSILFMGGMLVGAITFGPISDRFGRRKANMINMSFAAIVVTSSAFCQDIISYSVLRFLCGVGAVGFNLIYVWGVESVGKDYRVVCGFIYQIMFTVGSVIIGAIAYFVRDWRTLQLITGVPLFVMIFIYFITPESILWLISQKRYKEARKLINKATKVNGKTVPEELLSTRNSATNLIDKEIKNDVGPSQSKESLIDIFRSPVMLKRLMFTTLIWTVISMGYYSITYSANNLSGNFYLNYQLVMLVEIPAYIVGKFIVNRFGRKPALMGGLLAGGLACLATGLVPQDPPYIRITLSLTGKFFATAICGVIYAYIVELFPTSTRAAAVGFCSTSGRVGAMIAPVLANAGRTVDQALPYIIFGCLYISVAFLSLLLPETKGTHLPITIADAIELEKNSSSFCCRSPSKKNNSPSHSNGSIITMELHHN